MNEKIKLLQLANEKIADNSDFMAFYLKKYAELENVAEREICASLDCSQKDYYKLALCKAPDVKADDFANRLNKIGEYTDINVFGLSKIIKRVHSIIMLSGSNTSYLMAARDKNNKEQKK